MDLVVANHKSESGGITSFHNVVSFTHNKTEGNKENRVFVETEGGEEERKSDSELAIVTAETQTLMSVVVCINYRQDGYDTNKLRSFDNVEGFTKNTPNRVSIQTNTGERVIDGGEHEVTILTATE